jgi:hypothetical protein
MALLNNRIEKKIRVSAIAERTRANSDTCTGAKKKLTLEKIAKAATKRTNAKRSLISDSLVFISLFFSLNLVI